MKKVLLLLLVLLVVANLLLVVTGNTHVYKGLRHTYLVGKNKPDITDLEVFDTREIAVGEPEPWPKHADYGTPALKGPELDRLAELQSAALVVIKNDSLLFEQYWLGFEESSTTNSFSMAKSFVSMLAGIAIEEGKINSVFQPLGDHLPEFTEGEKAQLNLWHMLTMSPGLEWQETTTPFSDLAKIGYTNDLRSVVMDRDLFEKPGKEFRYGSGFTQIAGYFVEHAVEQDLSTYMSEMVWRPIGAENTAYWSLDGNGDERSYCCFYATARDFARLGKLYLDSGRWNGAQVVPEPWVLSSVTPAKLLDRGQPNTRYGLSWWMDDHAGQHFFYARGLRGQYIICLPELDLIIVRTGHIREEDAENGHPPDVYDWIDMGIRLAQ